MLIETNRTNGYTYTRVEVDGLEPVPLVPMGDFHYGSPHCALDELKKRIQWIKEKKALWIGMGDFLEMATKTSIGAGVFEQVVKPQQQEDDMIQMLEPIKDTCIALVKGNHEERAHKLTGLDPMAAIARALDVAYAGWESWGMISNKDIGYSFYAVHGGSGHKNAALLMNMIDRDMRKFITTDIIMRAHSHDRVVMDAEVYDVIPFRRAVRTRTQWMVGTGHFLERAESYVAGKGHSPKPIGTIALWLSFREASERQIKPEYL